MQNFQTLTLYANGLQFTCLEQGTGPLMLCLHGFPDHARSFRHQLNAFAAQGYHVVAPFMRGYAPTTAPADNVYQTAALAQDAIALIEALGAETAVVVGHDWGAAAAQGAAVLAPQKIRKLITIAVPYGGGLRKAFIGNPVQQRRSWYMFFFQMPFAEQAVALDDFAFIERAWQEWSPNWSCPAEEMAAIKRTFAQPGVLSAALGYYRASFGGRFRSAALDEAQQRIGREPIRVPTLYVHGANDGCIGVEVCEGMETSFTNTFHKIIIPDAGHFVHQEQPETFNQIVAEFLAA